MDFRWLQCVSIGPPIVTNGPHRWVTLIMGEAMHAGAEGTWEISVPSLRFCCEPKTALKTKFLQIHKLENTTAFVVGREDVERRTQESYLSGNTSPPSHTGTSDVPLKKLSSSLWMHLEKHPEISWKEWFGSMFLAGRFNRQFLKVWPGCHCIHFRD